MERPKVHVGLPKSPIRYPFPFRQNRHETIFDIQAVDPYRWMEEGEEYGLQHSNFIRGQMKLLREFMKDHPDRDEMERKLIKLYSYLDCSCPRNIGNGRYLVAKRHRRESLPIWYVESLSKKIPSRVLLDPTSEGGIIDDIAINNDLVAYTVQLANARFVRIRFRRISTGEILQDKIDWVKYTNMTWTSDGHGFIYSGYPPPPDIEDEQDIDICPQKVYYHQLGTAQSEDICLASWPNEISYLIPAVVTDDGHYVLLLPEVDCVNNLIYYTSLKAWMLRGRKPLPKLKPIITEFEAEYKYLGSDSTILYFRTNKYAANFRIVSFDLSSQTGVAMKEVIEELDDAVLELCYLIENYVFASYLYHVRTIIRIYNLQNGEPLQEFQFGPKNIVEVSGGGRQSKEIYFKLVSFDVPGIIYKLTVNKSNQPLPSTSTASKKLSSSESKRSTSKPTLAKTKSLPNSNPESSGNLNLLTRKTGKCWNNLCCGFRSDVNSDLPLVASLQFKSELVPIRMIIRQAFFESSDGQIIPMYICRAARVRPSNCPCILECYGAHGFAFKPYFRPLYTIFMTDMDGIVAFVNARGGGEYGGWHDAGRVLNKQATFDDVQCGAEFLLKHGYTRKDRLIITGIGPGGLAAAVCINQRPDLFAGAIVRSCPVDMLRYHRNQIGYSWLNEYGSNKREDEAQNLLGYSPLHNIAFPISKKVQYPSTLVTMSGLDDHALQAHMMKYVAELQFSIGSRKDQTRPLLMRYGRAMESKVDEDLDILVFISYVSTRALNR